MSTGVSTLWGNSPRDILASFPGSLFKNRREPGNEAKHIQLDAASGLIPMQDPAQLYVIVYRIGTRPFHFYRFKIISS